MPQVIETTNIISETMDRLIDFIALDEALGFEFENYLTKNKIEIQKESELNDVIIDYILEGKLQTGVRVLDYFLSKNTPADKKTINALKNSFVSFFKINKILKNSYIATDELSEKEYTLIPLVKTVNLRGVGLYDYIKARVIEIDNNFYLLEIHDVISQYREYYARVESVKALIKNPKIAVLGNREKLLEIKKSISSFHSSFLECFNSEEIIFSNKEADNILNNFYLFYTGKTEKVEPPKEYDGEFGFFEIEEFKNENILQNALSGFSDSDKTYDIGLFSDFSTGLYVVPFLGTLNGILKSNSLEIKGAVDCIKYFLTSDKIPPNLLIKKDKEYNNFVQIVNKALNQNYETIDEIIDFYKSEYKDGLRLSVISILYNSEIFSEILGEKKENRKKDIGRNEPCPCGSGKKYKKCCMNK